MMKLTCRSWSLIGVFCLGSIFQLGASAPVKLEKVVSEAFTKIQTSYVDTINEQAMLDYAIHGMLQALDPHSYYFTKEELERVNEQMQGYFYGVGLTYLMVQDTLMVNNVIGGGPADLSGLWPGDRVLAIDHKPIAHQGLKTTEISSLIRGKRYSKVSLTVLRHGHSMPFDLAIERDKISTPSIQVSTMLNDSVGYVQLNRFQSTTYKEFVQALTELKAKGMTHFIINLENNGGGYLSTVLNMTSQLLDQGDLMVYTKGQQSKRKDYRVQLAQGLWRNQDLVVLINGASASASEIMAGALQDQDRATIIGQRSFGKGLVQKPINLSDGSQIRLTIARFYMPSGRNFQKPYGDPKNNFEAYNDEFQHRKQSQELFNEDSIHYLDTTPYFTLKKHRRVYAQSGVTPDVFVPLDTAYNTPLFRSVFTTGLFYALVSENVMGTRTELLEKYPTFEAFRAHNDSLQTLDAIYAKLMEEAQQETRYHYSEAYEMRSRAKLKLMIKAQIALLLYKKIDNYYCILCLQNPSVMGALEYINIQN